MKTDFLTLVLTSIQKLMKLPDEDIPAEFRD
jgi:hypothetical protein